MSDAQFRNILPAAAEKTVITPHDSGIKNKEEKIDPDAFRKKLQEKKTDTENRKKERHYLQETEGQELAKTPSSTKEEEEAKDPSPYTVQAPKNPQKKPSPPPTAEESSKPPPPPKKVIDQEKLQEETTVSLSIDSAEEMGPATLKKEPSSSPTILDSEKPTSNPAPFIPTQKSKEPQKEDTQVVFEKEIKETPSIEKTSFEAKKQTPTSTSLSSEPSSFEPNEKPIEEPKGTLSLEPKLEKNFETKEVTPQKTIKDPSSEEPAPTQKPISMEEPSFVEPKEHLQEAKELDIPEKEVLEELQEMEPFEIPLEKPVEHLSKSESYQEEKSSTTDVFEKPLEKGGEKEGDQQKGDSYHGPTFFSFAPQSLNVEKTPPPYFTSLPADVLALFERMVGSLTVIDMMKNKKETTIDLSNQQFSSSIFFGSKITIIEFAQAPKVYNISFEGSPEAVALFNAHKKTLEDSFKQEEKGFSVHLLEAHLLKEKDER